MRILTGTVVVHANTRLRQRATGLRPGIAAEPIEHLTVWGKITRWTDTSGITCKNRLGPMYCKLARGACIVHDEFKTHVRADPFKNLSRMPLFWFTLNRRSPLSMYRCGGAPGTSQLIAGRQKRCRTDSLLWRPIAASSTNAAGGA